MMKHAYVFYRYPYADTFTVMRQYSGTPKELCSYNCMAGHEGYVFAPFKASDKNPILLIEPDEIETRPVNNASFFSENEFQVRDIDTEYELYINNFNLFHDKLIDGSFDKIVLSRRSVERSYESIDPELLFMRACSLYPRMFIALIHTPQSGKWLTATPEILIESANEQLHTMAIAGTMKLSDTDTDISLKERKDSLDISEWGRKDKREQHYVAKYIKDCLGDFSDSIVDYGPYTLRAGMVKHLATDFFFTLADNKDLGNLVNELHPTPAVCGAPKMPTYKFIIENEACEREYYSGFSGPLNCDEGTHFYVTLRCMKIENTVFSLYAGGGLLSDSDGRSEWFETEAKMETMRKCLAIKRI